MWIEYHHCPFHKEVIGIYRGTKEQIVQKFKDDWGDEELDYNTLMSYGYQSDMDFTLEEVEENLIIDLK